MITPTPEFEEEFHTLLYQIFKSAGIPLSPDRADAIRRITPKLASAISREARKEALTLVKRLQAATMNGFEEFAKSIDRLEKAINHGEEPNSSDKPSPE